VTLVLGCVIALHQVNDSWQMLWQSCVCADAYLLSRVELHSECNLLCNAWCTSVSCKKLGKMLLMRGTWCCMMVHDCFCDVILSSCTHLRLCHLISWTFQFQFGTHKS
jgi:hypothetical protein